jgi:hypothetical protein
MVSKPLLVTCSKQAQYWPKQTTPFVTRGPGRNSKYQQVATANSSSSSKQQTANSKQQKTTRRFCTQHTAHLAVAKEHSAC